MRILLIEDDSATAQSVELMLRAEGMHVYTTDLGEDGADIAKLYDYDCIVLDMTLPDMTGLEVIKHLRVSKVQTAIISLIASDIVTEKVAALGAGADDVMTKPFHKDELIARIYTVVRRAKGHTRSMIKVDQVMLDTDAREVLVADKSLHLTGKEYAMLELLMLRKNVCISKEMFLNHLYGGTDEPEAKIIDVFLCKLRRKLKNAGAPDGVIETVWGRGYMMRDNSVPVVGSPSLVPDGDLPVMPSPPLAANDAVAL